jgi:hypothetical protein
MERTGNAQTESLWIPRRRVAVKVQLADQSKLAGQLYADQRRPDGTPGRVVDRLNDTAEQYLPLALQDRHVLLNKAAIVTVHVDDADRELSVSDELVEHHVRVNMCDRSQHVGKVHGILPFTQRRALDYLNNMTQRFLSLHASEKVILLNTEYVMGVVEVISQE